MKRQTFDPLLGRVRTKDTDKVQVGGGTASGGSGGSAPLETKDEGISLTTTTSSLNFTGSGVTATNSGNDVTVDISGGASAIPEYTTDPVSPSPEDAWVLKTTSGGSGTSGKVFAYGGLGFPLIQAGGGTTTYQFSYRTLEATTIRVTMA